jgi:simple sugar transport system ATP-binding protein
MRQGETVERTPTGGTTPAALARAMVGRDVALAGAMLGASTPAAAPSAPTAALVDVPALVVRDLVVAGSHTPQAVATVSFTVFAGEIFGIAGVEGNGQTELIEALAGLRPISSGSIRLGDREIGKSSVRDRADHGMSHVPEDRHRRGLVLEYSVADNLILGAQHRFSRRGVLDRPQIVSYVVERIAAFDIRPHNPFLPARALSGGNQQKVVIAREMARQFSVLLAAQPTRGVDVGAIEQIHDRLRAARAAGKAILLVSAELSEIMALADRIAVMYGGRFAVIVQRADATEEMLGRFMTGAETGHAGGGTL